MKVYLCHDTREQVNWGCKATTSCLINLIEKSGGEIIHHQKLSTFQSLKIIPNSNFLKSILPYDSQLRYFIRKFFWNIEKYRRVKNGYVWKFDQFYELADHILRGKVYQTELKKMNEADVIIVNGEGSIYKNELKGILTYFFAYFAAVHLNKPSVLVNHHADLRNANMYEIAKNVYPKLSKVVFRDPVAMNNYKHLTDLDKCLYGGDAAFCYRKEFDNQYLDYDGRASSAICLSEKKFICLGGSSSLMRPDEKVKWPNKSYEILIKKLRNLNLDIVLIGSDNTDDIFLKPLSKKLNLLFYSSSTHVSEAFKILSSASCLISGRWHSAVLASIAGTPTVTLSSNSMKMSGINKIFGLDDDVYEVNDIESSSNAIYEKTKLFLHRGEKLRRIIRTKAANETVSALNNVSIIEDLK